MGKNRKRNSKLREVWYRLKRNKQAVFGLIIFGIIIIVTILSGFIFDYKTEIINQDISNRLQPPSMEHYFGTDSFGRDCFARVLYGGRISLRIGIQAMIFSLIPGGLLGAIAGYYGGKIDNVIMRFMDIILSIPAILLAIAIVSALGPGFNNLIIALAIADIPKYSRLARSQALTIKDLEFIEASKIAGSSDIRIIFVHIIPNALVPVVVKATMGMGLVIISAAAMSFLGLGIMPPAPEWGAMLAEGKRYIRYSPHLVIFPGLAIMLTVLSLNFIGDGLRDALDPKLKD